MSPVHCHRVTRWDVETPAVLITESMKRLLVRASVLVSRNDFISSEVIELALKATEVKYLFQIEADVRGSKFNVLLLVSFPILFSF